jgi:hypothetical protein
LRSFFPKNVDVEGGKYISGKIRTFFLLSLSRTFHTILTRVRERVPEEGGL